MLNGYKTYIVAVLIMAAALLSFYGVLTPDTYALILGILGGGAVATVRSAIK